MSSDEEDDETSTSKVIVCSKFNNYLIWKKLRKKKNGFNDEINGFYSDSQDDQSEKLLHFEPACKESLDPVGKFFFNN